MNSKFYCLQVLARLNVATLPLMARACASKFKRTTCFRCLTRLIEEEYVTRVAHPKRAISAFKVTPKGYAAVYGPESEKLLAQKETDLLHSLACAETIVNLGHYKNISGFTTESELTKDALESFCYERRPDIIIQVTSGQFSYELAVEVESSIKTTERIDQILEVYDRTFKEKLYCRGLIIIPTRPGIFKVYQERIAKRSKQFDSKILLANEFKLTNLNTDVYGHRSTQVELEWNLFRTQFQGGVKYIPLESSSYESKHAAKSHILGSQSQSEISGGFNVKDEEV